MAFSARIADLIAEDKTGLLAKHPSWERVPLCEVASILNGAPFDSSLFNNSTGHPLVRIRDVVAGSTGTYYDGDWDDTYRVEQGDQLIGMDGDFNSAFWRSAPALLNQRVCKVSAAEAFYDRRFLAFALPGYLAAINANTPSITVKHLSSRTIGEIELPLPPRAEQSRIVAKLEELLSELDAGVAELKAAQKKLKQYRQSLLKAAVEGSLTAAWRARPENQNPAETGAELLARILKERRARWEAQQLAKFEAQGKAPPKGWQGKYVEPVAPDVSDLPALPQGWVWATVDQLSHFVRNGLSKTPNLTGIGLPILRINAVRPMSVSASEIKHLDAPESEVADYFVDVGDLLATRYNGSVELLGVFGLMRQRELRVLHPDKLIRLKPVLKETLGSWVEVAANTGASRSHIVDRVKTTAGQTGISGEDLKKMPVPLPPLSEQDASVSMLDELLVGVRHQTVFIDQALGQSTAQRQNLLRAAFSGQLVPQDPADEPASVLLARIRAEREAAHAGRKPAAGVRAKSKKNVLKESA